MKSKKTITSYYVLFFFLFMICLLKAEDEPSEIGGKIFINENPRQLPREPEMLAGLWTGSRY